VTFIYIRKSYLASFHRSICPVSKLLKTVHAGVSHDEFGDAGADCAFGQYRERQVSSYAGEACNPMQKVRMRWQHSEN
jgi:hypothetical protein